MPAPASPRFTPKLWLLCLAAVVGLRTTTLAQRLADPARPAHTLQQLSLPNGQPELFLVDVVWGGAARQLLLRRHDLRGPDFHLRIWDGVTMRTVAAPLPRTYRGEILGEADSQVFASLGPDGLHARILPAEGLGLRLEPASLGSRQLTTGHGGPSQHAIRFDSPEPASDLDCPGGAEPGLSSAHLGSPTSLPGASSAPGLSTGLAGGTTSVAEAGRPQLHPGGFPPLDSCIYVCDLAFDCDYEFFLAQGADVAAVLARVETLLNPVDFFYSRDARITYEISELIVRTAPYYTPLSGGDLLDQFRIEWNTVQASVPRDVAHLMTGKPGSLIEFGGLAYVGAMCSDTIGYGWSMDSSNVLGHELGHNWGSSHCHDAQPCNTMCGGCFYIAPISKDIMAGTRDSAPCLSVRPGHLTPMPPYAHPDELELRKNELAGLTDVAFDVLGNDHDGNCDHLTLGSFESTGSQGGSLVLSEGSGPAGRDELLYTPPTQPFVGADRFEYLVQDGTGRSSTGEVVVESRPLDLAGYWRLDDVAGSTAADATPHARDGLTEGGPTWGSGQIAGSLDFDGVDDAVSIPALDLGTDELTITAWLRRDGPQVPVAGIVFCRAGSTVAGLNFGNANELRYHWNDTPASYNWNSGLVVPNTTWVFVALVIEPDQATAWLYDGSLQSAVKPASHAPEAFDGVLTLGKDPGSASRDFQGSLDDVRVYDYALSPTQIADLALNGGAAAAPRPADGGKLPEPEWGLRWVPGTSADSHDIYFGTDDQSVRNDTTSGPSFQTNQLATQFVPVGLVEGVTYFWRVDERVGGLVIPGPLWQFQLAGRHHWALDEGAGVLVADSAGGANGSYVGGPLLGQPGAAPGTGTAVAFDGLNDRVSVPALNLDSNRATLTAWVRRNGPQSPWAGLAFSRAGSTVAGLNFGEADELRYHWNGSSQTWGWDSGLIVPDDTWTFVALVVEPDRAQLAMSVGTTLLTSENLVNHATEAFDGNLEFARDSGFSNRWFDGSLDDVRLYDVALSLVELQQLLDDAH